MPTKRLASLAAVTLYLAFLFMPLPAFADDDSATISGTVADSVGAPLGAARVTLSGDGIAAARAITEAGGQFRFPAIAPHHRCSVTAERDGFRSITYEGMVTEPGRTRVVHFRLKRPGEHEVVVLVTQDPFPHDEFLRGFAARVGVPVRVIDLDRETDPAEAVRRTRAERPDLIVSAGLRAARLVRGEVRDVPSILTLITDPRRFDLETETTGLLISQPDANELIERVSSVLPTLRRVGMVYQSDTSSLLARDLRHAVERRGLSFELRPCRTVADLPSALDGLQWRINALIVPNDDLTATPRAREIITTWALKNHVPLAAPTPEWVRGGALFSYGASYARLGEETSRVAELILGGAREPSDFTGQWSGEFELTVNRATAKQLGVEIPAGLQIDAVY